LFWRVFFTRTGIHFAGKRSSRQSEPRQFDLGDRELARHQKRIAEFYLVDVEAGAEMPPPPQAERAHRGGAKIQFLEIHAHAPDPVDRGCKPRPGIAAALPPPSHQAHRRALAKAGRERVERRDARRWILPDPPQKL